MWFSQNTGFLNQGLQIKIYIFLHAPCRNSSGFPPVNSPLLDLILSKFPGKYGPGCVDSTTDIWEMVFSALAHGYPFSRRKFPPSVCGFGVVGTSHLLQHPFCPAPAAHCTFIPHTSSAQRSVVLEGAEWYLSPTLWSWSRSSAVPHLLHLHCATSHSLHPSGHQAGLGPTLPLCACDKWLLDKHPQVVEQTLLLVILQSGFPALTA